MNARREGWHETHAGKNAFLLCDDDACGAPGDGSVGEYVLGNLDLTRAPTILVRHDLYAERAITKSEISAAPSGPSSNTRELNIDLAERP